MEEGEQGLWVKTMDGDLVNMTHATSVTKRGARVSVYTSSGIVDIAECEDESDTQRVIHILIISSIPEFSQGYRATLAGLAI